MISKALQTELFRIKIDSLGKKIPKFPEFNLIMIYDISYMSHIICKKKFNPTKSYS